MMFSNDTVTFSYEACGPQNLNIYTSGDSTILGVSFQQENVSSNTILECGSDDVAKNYATNYSYVPMMYQCTDDIQLSKTGQDCAFVVVNYLPYLTSDYPTTTIGYNPPTQVSSTSDVVFYGSFTSGELMISFLLVLQVFLMIVFAMLKSLRAINTKKKYIEYSNGDVPINETL